MASDAEANTEVCCCPRVENVRKAPEPSALSALDALRLRGLKNYEITSLFTNSFMLYTLFLMGGSALHHKFGGDFQQLDIFSFIGYLSAIMEAFGLMWLRYKISKQNSVSGISGMSMAMYALVYTIRAAMGFPLDNVDQCAVKCLEIAAVVIVFEINWQIFKTHRETYQADLDVLKLQYLIPGCLLLAVVLHPDIREGEMGNMVWTSCLYLDIAALMPQVVMMSRGMGSVQAPIAHFVAATAFSRGMDLWFWYYAFNSVGPIHKGPEDYNLSGWLIVFFHVFHLCLVADFLYLYLKARCRGEALTEDLSIPIDGDDVLMAI